MPKYSQQGYKITFECSVCGKEHYLENMHYNEDGKRICDECFKDFREKQVKGK